MIIAYQDQIFKKLHLFGGNHMDGYKSGADALFVLLGAIMILAMHAGFAFLELGTVRKKNQVNALVKILVDFSISTIAYFFIGYSIAYGVRFSLPRMFWRAKMVMTWSNSFFC
jgi:ammonia channel protein AmtB